MQRQAEEKNKEPEERSKDTVRALKEEFEWKNESKMRYTKEENQKINDVKESRERRLGGEDTEEVERGAREEDRKERESFKQGTSKGLYKFLTGWENASDNWREVRFVCVIACFPSLV